MMTSKDTARQRAQHFANGYLAWLLCPDSSWWRICMIDSISDDDARIAIVAGGGELRLDDPFYLISSTGAAQRRCALRDLDGTRMSVSFVPAIHA